MGFQEPVEEICFHAGIGINAGQPWDLRVLNDNFYQRVISDGSLGLGETYMLGWWEADDLFGFFERLFAAGVADGRKYAGWRARVAFLKARLLNVQTVAQTQSLADAHYNLSNELFEAMLGPSMAYSCAYWQDADDLDQAQFNKFDLICRKLGLAPGMRLLDVGCGWGGLARHAAKRHGVEVVGLTISQEQAAYAQDFCADLPVRITCEDYRSFGVERLGGTFDAVVSVGMIEHVGYRNYRRMFEMVDCALKRGGLFLLHTIGTPISAEAGDPWLTKYIFPGGMLPSMRQLSDAAEGLYALQDVQNIGVHYTPTLKAWLANFEAYRNSTTRTRPLPEVWGSTDVFCRMWRYYLLSCAAEFSTGGSHVWQSVFAKGHLRDGYVGAR